MGPNTVSDGHDFPWLINEVVPGVAAMVDDVFMGCEDAVGQPVISQELADVFDRVELGRTRRQGKDGDIVGHVELARGVQPA